MSNASLQEILAHTDHNNVVPFDHTKDTLIALDFTSANKTITTEIVDDTELFSIYVSTKIKAAKGLYGIGGYNENRTVYQRSKVFDPLQAGGEPRSLHLGIDIWGSAGVPVFVPMAGEVHSFACNDKFGDYGATIILLHQVDGISFHSLYGHLSLRDLDDLYEGKVVNAGEPIAHFGEPAENGHWPPHLHFQLIIDMEGNKGDYPGVCRLSEREKYLRNCPDPDLLLQMMQYA